MIVAFVREQGLQAAILNAALAEEDVIFGVAEGLDAVHHGFPRLILVSDAGHSPLPSYPGRPELPVLRITTWGSGQTIPGRGSATSPSGFPGRLRAAIREAASSMPWVEELFRDMAAAAGAPLPPAFRGFARRVLEYPARYDDLHAMARLTGLSRGALKARFRRQGLRSPADHLRWLRALAVAHVLRDGDVTTVEASYRLGYTSNGNLCRAIQSIAGVSPARLRTQTGRSALLLRFVARFAEDPEAMRRWRRFENIFLRREVA